MRLTTERKEVKAKEALAPAYFRDSFVPLDWHLLAYHACRRLVSLHYGAGDISWRDVFLGDPLDSNTTL